MRRQTIVLSQVTGIDHSINHLTDTLLQVMEVLSRYRFGAMPVRDGPEPSCGVISKTDLPVSLVIPACQREPTAV
jgi:hypothetical protein